MFVRPTAFFGRSFVPVTVSAVNFDGTNDYLTRGADLTGNVDSQIATVSFWVKPNGATNRFVLGAENLKFDIRITSTGFVQVIGVNTGATTILTMSSANALANGVFHNVLMWWDLSIPDGEIYVQDVLDLAVSPTLVNNGNLDYTASDWTVGAQTAAGANKMNGCLAEIYFNNAELLKFSLTSNRRKFITLSKKPVSLGANGELPTGTTPIIYQSGDKTAFVTNKGSGGGFAENGALTDCATSPSD